MEQTVKVRNLCEDGTAEVIHIRQSACSGDCHKCAGCGAVGQTLTVIAQNPIGAAEGEQVIIRSDTAPVMKGALVLYVLPLVMFFVGYALGAIWSLGAWFAAGAFLLAMAGAVVYDRCVCAKQTDVYTIIGYSQGSAESKGDN